MMEFTPQVTEDGSHTFFSTEFAEAFHSIHGAKKEAEVKFVQPTRLRELAQKHSHLKILDICYGLGYNSAAAIAAIWQTNPQCQIELMALELSLVVPQNAIAHDLLATWQQPIPELLEHLAQELQVNHSRLVAKLLIGDARQSIQQLNNQKWQADAIFLDPFSPPKCPQLWSVEFIQLVVSCLKPTGRLATYSCSAAVRTALSMSGLQCGSTPGMGRKSPGTVANYQGVDLTPLSLQEQEHLQTRAAIPYRDPSLAGSKDKIKQQREEQQLSSSLESTSQWKKRWLSQS